ncbi:two-partner secretion domain-containing protein [Massilia sp. LjRoot122]|uniref:two-partner secretion domain-containing protein n=1 Tax=Massilia sp. LjRoot122 TaxID=3342257 RepID=UPI003ECF46ED
MRNGLIRLSRAALCVAACFGAASTAAAPTLPKVVAGQASFSQEGNVFSITNTPGTIINWQSFSVNAGEITRFIQQSSDSAVLNRIVGQDPSQILGALQSNGKVFLINPNGVLFGRDSRVDVGGLVASTLNMTDADFLAGKQTFTAGPNAGSVRNEGAITTPGGGKVFLVAPNVENAGVITAPNGEVMLAAGSRVELVDAGNPDLTVVVSAPGDQAINLGQVVANGGRVGIYGALVNQRGVVNANSATVGQDGKIVLKASRDIVLEQGSVTKAGGDIDLRAGNQLSLNEGSALYGANYIDLKAERMTLAGMIDGVGGVKPVVSFNTFNNGTDIFVHASQVNGALALDPARLGAFGAYEINIGNSGHTGHVVIDKDLSLAGNLLIDTGGSIDINAPVLLTGATSQFLATQHGKGGYFQVRSGASIGGARRIGVDGGGRIAIDGALNAGEIDLGAGSSGITLTANLTAGSRATLRTSGDIHQGSAIVKTPALLVEANSVTMMGNNEVGTLAGVATGTAAGAGFRLRWTGELRIGSVGERAGLTSQNDLTLTGGGLVVDQSIEAPVAILADVASIRGEGTLRSNVLSLQSRGGIGEATRPLRTSTNVLMNATNTATGSAPINIVNDRALVVGNVVQEGSANGGAISIESTGGLTVGPTSTGQQGVRTGSGDIRLVTHSPLTINGTVSTDSGNVTLLADNKGLLTIGAGGQVKSVSGSVQITAGDTVIPANGIDVAPGKLSVTKTNAPQDPGLPPPLDICLADPNAQGCGNVIEQATRACMANPEAEQCGRVLPPPQSCRTNPDRLGCGVVLVRECIATPKAPSCTGVLPPYETCEKTPGTYGCAPVITEHNAITACMATPKAPSCAGVLPVYATCEKTPNAHGCAPVIAERQAITACIATPAAPGCGELLPQLETCRLDAGVYGCVPVLDRAAFLACVANPSATGCAARLPALAICKASPGIEGCAQVLKLTFDACLINKNDPSCSGILPTLSQCVVNKATPGCEVVLPTLQQCIASPSLQGCSVLLPTLSQCVANKATPGCDAVLPTLQQCIVSPTLQGCAVLLPTLAQCAANPNQAGCEAVLPQPGYCSTHPADPKCVVFNPAPAQGGAESKQPVAAVQQTTVTLVNSRTPAQEKLPPAPAAAPATAGMQDGGEGTPAEQSEKQAGPAAATNTGVKNEKPAAKMYCN